MFTDPGAHKELLGPFNDWLQEEQAFATLTLTAEFLFSGRVALSATASGKKSGVGFRLRARTIRPLLSFKHGRYRRGQFVGRDLDRMV